MRGSNNFIRYFPSDQRTRDWGWELLDAGHQAVPPGSAYPPSAHPEAYLFDESGRRTLDEYQIVYIAQGGGTFQSRSQEELTVRAGQAFLLFPGEWHSYRPSVAEGWHEYWAGFRGREAKRLMRRFFSPSRPLQAVTHGEELLDIFARLLHWLRRTELNRELVLASHLPQILALLLSAKSSVSSPDLHDLDLIRRAKAIMVARLPEHTELKEVAKDLGVSYSRFRFAFKKHTGLAPREFENQVKMNRACELLRRKRLSVTETASALGYSSVYYFSRVFKKQFGRSPQQWLRGIEQE